VLACARPRPLLCASARRNRIEPIDSAARSESAVIGGHLPQYRAAAVTHFQTERCSSLPSDARASLATTVPPCCLSESRW
jgi:hypothetical protein